MYLVINMLSSSSGCYFNLQNLMNFSFEQLTYLLIYKLEHEIQGGKEKSTQISRYCV